MDVRKFLFIFSFSALLIACSKGSNDDLSFNKIQDKSCAGASVSDEKLIKWKDGRVTRVKGQLKEKISALLEKQQNEIEYVEDNYRVTRPVQSQSLRTFASPPVANWGVQNIRAAELWNKNIRGDGMIVAIIDSGIDRQHAQLQNQLFVNPNEVVNGIDDDHNGYVDDINGYDFSNGSGQLQDTTGHGTHVAGIIAAQHGTGPIQGVAPGAKVMSLDFFGGESDGTVFDAIKAIRYAVASGARVINASWGGPGCSRSLKNELSQLSAQNVLFIAAAGNDGQDITYSPSYPASFQVPHQIAVGARTMDGYTAGFSNYGDLVNLVAPGANIVSTFPKNQYEVLDGTSMATPFVSGAAALLWSAFPQAKAKDIKNAILNSAVQGPYPVETRGSLNVASAYEILKQQFETPAP